jgi:hypothetical protein
LETSLSISKAESEQLQKSLEEAELAKEAAEARASTMEKAVLQMKEEVLGLCALLQNAGKEIVNLKVISAECA